MTKCTRVNLHCHSDLSDGVYSPEMVAELLVRDGVRCAALADHDTVAGLERFRHVLKQHGVGYVPAVEITARLRTNELHLLAYGFDTANPELLQVLSTIRKQRHIGLQTVLESIRSSLRSANGEPKSDLEEMRTLSPYTCAEIIDVVHRAGGRVFLAHPMDVSPDHEEIARVVRELAGEGLDGIEAYCPGYDSAIRERFETLARSEGLLLVGGTDLHGPDAAGTIHTGIDVPTQAWKDFRSALTHAPTGANAEEDATTETVSRWQHLGLRIALPAVITIFLFLFTNFVVLIPAFEARLLDRKRETAQELTATAVSLLEQYAGEAEQGAMSIEEAQRLAAEHIGHLRYGPDRKDYFWITDTRPYMVMHPYRPELNGTDLSQFEDERGKLLFVETVNAVSEHGEGFVEYMWQWQDDSGRIVPKLSHVRIFKDWDWIIGTGIYVEDVVRQINQLTERLVWIAVGISILVVGLLIYLAQYSIRIERQRIRMKQALADSREKYRILVETAHEGTLMLIDGKCSYANRAILDMLAYSLEEMALLDVQDILPDARPEENATVQHVMDMLAGRPAPVRYDGQLRRKNGDLVNAVLTCQKTVVGGRDGLILSAQISHSEGRTPAAEENKQKALLEELQSSLVFLNEPVSHFLHETVSCPLDTTIGDVSRLMTRCEFSAALVLSESGQPIGIVTDGDLRRRVLAANHDPRRAVHEIMTSPLVCIDEGALVYEALLRMQEAEGRHLAVRDTTGVVVGVVRFGDLLEFHRYASAVIVDEIKRAKSVGEVVAARDRLPVAVASMVSAGAKAQSVTRLLSAVHDAATQRLLRLAMDEIGAPPVRFAFVAMGSHGRQEETLITDQDNGILYEDLGSAHDTKAVSAYFLALGQRVCQDLDAAGYPFCKAGMMAREATWCAPLSAWKKNFRQWIVSSEPNDILHFDMCFDFRCVYGAEELTNALREDALDCIASRPESLAHFAHNTLLYKPPTRFFGKLVGRGSGEQKNALDLKDACMTLVKVARLYALRERLHETNTLERFSGIYRLGGLLETGYEDTRAAYEFLMQLRFHHQVNAVLVGESPDNLVPHKELTHLDEATLHESFTQLSAILKRVSYDFLGSDFMGSL